MNAKEYFKKHPVKLSKKAEKELDFKFMIGNLITQIRLEKGLTQAQIARKIGTKQPAISRIESYSYTPSLKVLNKIADKCGYKLIVRLAKE